MAKKTTGVYAIYSGKFFMDLIKAPTATYAKAWWKANNQEKYYKYAGYKLRAVQVKPPKTIFGF